MAEQVKNLEFLVFNLALRHFDKLSAGTSTLLGSTGSPLAVQAGSERTRYKYRLGSTSSPQTKQDFIEESGGGLYNMGKRYAVKFHRR
jgi:hypothetical protein